MRDFSSRDWNVANGGTVNIGDVNDYGKPLHSCSDHELHAEIRHCQKLLRERRGRRWGIGVVILLVGAAGAIIGGTVFWNGGRVDLFQAFVAVAGVLVSTAGIATARYPTAVEREWARNIAGAKHILKLRGSSCRRQRRET